jgi:hypothetical protein
VTLSRTSSLGLLIAAMLVSPDPIESQSMTVTTAGGEVRVQAPGFRFITGEPLARLKDGLPVRVELTLGVLAGPGAAPAVQQKQAFVLSYDLWEERFAAAVSGTGARSMSHLTSAAAEAWCVQQLAVSVNALGALRTQPFWIRLESRMLNGTTTGGRDDDGLTLKGIIETLSRRQASDTSHSAEGGPFKVQR